MKLLTNFFSYIGRSIKAGDPVSTPRFQSWILLCMIILQIFMFIIFEIFTFYMSLHTGVYTISNESLIVYGMTLSHQLALVFSRKSSQSINEIKGKKEETNNTNEEIKNEAN